MVVSRKIFLIFLFTLVIGVARASADCRDLIHSNTGDYYYPDPDWPSSAHAHAKIETSRIYGEDCTYNPYKNYARVRVRCQGDHLYLYRMSQNANWDDAKKEITCNKWGCAGPDETTYSTGSTHTITLRSNKGDMRSAFFVCYDYHETSDYWAWAWTGMGYWGDKKVFKSRASKKCYDDDIYWYDSLDRREDKYKECGSKTCGSWGQNYCDGDDVKQDRTCTERGCSDSTCFEKTTTETKIAESCEGERTGNNYCYKGNVVRNIDEKTCLNGNCVWMSARVETVEKCKFGCVNGNCVQPKGTFELIFEGILKKLGIYRFFE